MFRISVVTQDAYTQAGVSQSDADASVAALVAHLGAIETGKPSRVVPLPGPLRERAADRRQPGIAFGTDGVGTKMVVAEELGRFETIGIDLIAMNVNDLICVGAEPIALVDFILCREATPEICGQIGEGLRAGAEQAGIEIPGGEIAQVGDVVHGWELGGSAIGLVDLDKIVTGERIEPGDALIGLPSSGLHSNGYTLARKVLADVPWDDDRLGRAARRRRARADHDLRPRRARAARLRRRRPRPRPHHGRRPQQPPAPLARGRLRAGATRSRCPPVFGLIQELGEISDEEMHEVFNMGLGFVCVVPAADVGRRGRAARSAPPGHAPRSAR